MAEPTIITWNVTNWITIFLMALLGFMLFNAAKAWYQQRQGG